MRETVASAGGQRTKNEEQPRGAQGPEIRGEEREGAEEWCPEEDSNLHDREATSS